MKSSELKTVLNVKFFLTIIITYGREHNVPAVRIGFRVRTGITAFSLLSRGSMLK